MLGKRLIAVNLSAAVLMAVMTGCGNTSAPASDPVSEQQSAEQTSEIPSQSADPEEQTEERESVPEEAMTTAVEAGQEEDQAPAEPEAFAQEKAAAIKALEERMKQEREAVYVYKDFGLTANHFTQKAKMYGSDEDLVKDMDEDWREDPYSGTSCIRCEVTTAEDDWGGWLFLNGYLPKGETTPLLNDGSEGGQGLDLRGAGRLCFMARGENGGETVEFFTGGFGYDGVTNRKNVEFPDSTIKRSAGRITLTDEWEEYMIPLSAADMSYIVCGFGFVLNDVMNGSADNVFYLDEIRFCGDISSAYSAPVMLRSYDTDNMYIQNAAFTYDNALAGMAFLSKGMKDQAKQIMDAFVYAVRNDRAMVGDGQADGTGPRRVRNAYAAGDISAFPGWESGAKLPGWYDNEAGEWYEDRYQVGSNVGNTSYAAMALMQYYKEYGGEQYLETARALMDWVIETCSDEGDGFTGGFDGWQEGDPPTVYTFTYKSIEHNIDAYAVFSALYAVTGEPKYSEAADSALRFIKSMYDSEQGLFMTGTLDDAVTPNTGVVVLDAQVWCAMALGEEFTPYADALKVVETMKTEEGGYPFCLENRNGGWWAEGTAYTALMYRGLGKTAEYEEAMKALGSIQLENGLFPAATVDNLSTGMELFDGSPWEYSTDAHIAPTAWFIMAANGFNPYVFSDK